MKNKYISFLLFVFFATLFVPAVIIAEDDTNEVFLLEKSDKLLAFSGRENNWFEQRLRPGEIVVKSKFDGNVAVAYTNLRIFGFSAYTGRWVEEKLRIKEIVSSIDANGNVGTAITDIRALGFSARTGVWVEKQFSIGN
jgi:hypothetical protein